MKTECTEKKHVPKVYVPNCPVPNATYQATPFTDFHIANKMFELGKCIELHHVTSHSTPKLRQ